MSDHGLFTAGHAALSSLASWLFTYALHSTVVLAAAWAGSRWIIRRRPALAEALWKVALVGGLLTASLQLAAGLEPLLGQWPVPSAAVDATAHPAISVASPALPATGAVAAPAAPGASLGSSWTGWMVGVWAAVALGFLASLAFSWWRLRARLADRREITRGAVPAMLDQLRRSAGYRRRVRLSSSQHLAVPITFGVLRPEICLPEETIAGLSPAEMRCILGHELAHLVRNDPAWHLFARLVEGVFFFQPFHRLAGRQLRQLSEYLCDDWTVERTGAPLELARCLTGVAQRVLQRPRLFPVPGMTGGGSELERRVRRLVEGRDLRLRRTPVRRFVLGMLAALLLVSLVAPGWSSDSQAETGEEPPAAAPGETEPPAEESPQEAELEAREIEEFRAQLEQARKQTEEIRVRELEEVRAQLEKARKQAEEIRAHALAEVRMQVEEARKQAEELRVRELEEVRAQLEKARQQAEELRARELDEARAALEAARQRAEEELDQEILEEDEGPAEETDDPGEDSTES